MFLTVCTFLVLRCMNVENSRQSLSKGRLRQRLSGFALRTKRLGVTADPDGSNSRWRKQNILDRNIFREDTRSSHDILIF